MAKREDSIKPAGHTRRHINRAQMEILIERQPWTKLRAIPFLRRIEKANRILDQAAEKEWVDDAERRLRDVVSRVDPQPILVGYRVERLDDGLVLWALSAEEV